YSDTVPAVAECLLTKNATEKDSTKLALPEVSKLVHGVVHLYKHRGGISMAQLKQKLAAEGYDVTKNNRQVKAATKRLVNNEAFVRTTRSASLRLNKKQGRCCHAT
uniref:Kell metallo-endopeptidase (Kell blood group) n=1 Tax=Oryzias latipes TaxID=8090 RepID=A0A3P9HSL3_ORYLA